MTYQTNIGRAAVGLFFCLVCSAPKAQEEAIVLDPSTGNYVINYRGFNLDTGTRSWQRVIFVPATKIDPVAKSRFKLTDQGLVAYHYKVKNASTSQQALSGFRALVSQANRTSQVVPQGWRGSVVPDRNTTNMRLNWSYSRQQAGDGLKPGNSQSGFGVESSDLPGVGMLRLRGATPTLAFPDEGPSQELSDKLDELSSPDSDSVPRLAAIPRIPNPTPFNAAVVLGSIQQHVKTDMVSMQLIDPALLAPVDRGLTQAIAAAQGGNTPSLLHEIMNLRQLLKQEHADVDKDDDGDRDDDDKNKAAKRQIDKLAARVLDFDLKYVERRVKGEKD